METFKESDLKELKDIQNEINKLVTSGWHTDFGEIRSEVANHWKGEAATKYLVKYDGAVAEIKKINKLMKDLVKTIDLINKTSTDADQKSETVFTK